MKPSIAAIVLAAGSSLRFGPENKLLTAVGGKPLVAHAVDAAIGAGAEPVIVVTGHDREGVERALGGRTVSFVHNPTHGQGMGSSIAAGVGALGEATGALIVLGDMPILRADHVRAVIAAFEPEHHGAICIPTFDGKEGHPVLFGRAHLAALAGLGGDRGARSIVEAHRDAVTEVEISDAGILQDVDRAEDL